MTGRARVLFKYPGGKSALVPRLLELAGGPVEGRYVDPFVGGGAVLEGVLGSGLAQRAVVWDAAVPVRQTWRAVRDRGELLSSSLEALKAQYAGAVAQGAGASRTWPGTARGR